MTAPGSPPATRGGPRPSRVPLRITLVALLMALVTLALLVTGVTAASLLKRYLVEQQGTQLVDSLREVRHDQAATFCLTGGQGWYGRQWYTPRGSYTACLGAGSPELVVVSGPRSAQRQPELSRELVTALVADAASWTTGRPGGGPPEALVRSVASRDGETTWLLAARQLPEGPVVVLGSDVGNSDEVIGALVAIEVVVGLIVLAALGLAGYGVVRNSLRPLTTVERTAQAIAAGDLSQRVPDGDGRTEVGRLALAINGMLARIESAFRAQQASEEQARASEERMRRFVADASHELRTPLTSIRGFAELYRQGAAGSPAETARLMQRIESEGARMGGLVEDLLQLARLDMQRPLSLTPVDLAEIAGDAVHDARVMQPDRPITLHVDDSLTEVPVVLGDEARLRQVVGNLVTNALVHTPRTAPVEVRIGEDTSAGGDRVVVQVADEGPGMAPEDAARVFERFYRADASRSRAAGGTGLGLSIVAALVAAHGGDVSLGTAPGRGATFTVRLPRSGPDLGSPPVPAGAPSTPGEGGPGRGTRQPDVPSAGDH